MKLGDPTFAGLAARLRAGTVTPADLDAAADAIKAKSIPQGPTSKRAKVKAARKQRKRESR
jgi:hypothetical protein